MSKRKYTLTGRFFSKFILFIIATLFSMSIYYVWNKSTDPKGRLDDFAKIAVNAIIVGLINGVVISQFIKSCTEISGSRKSQMLWRLNDPEKCIICISSKQDNMYKTYKRYVVGEGQIEAMPYIISSLFQGYSKDLNWNNFIHANSNRYPHIPCDTDTILIGGPYTNKLTKYVFDKLLNKFNLKINLENNSLGVFKDNCEVFKDNCEVFTKKHSQDFHNSTSNRLTDYGVIISCLFSSIHDETRLNRIVVLAGCNTYSTGAVSKYFCCKIIKNRKVKKYTNYIAIVKCSYSFDMNSTSPYIVNGIEIEKLLPF